MQGENFIWSLDYFFSRFKKMQLTNIINSIIM